MPLKLRNRSISWFGIGMIAIMILAVLLRLKGIHNPLLDHPNWRQGDMASIARNFAQLQFNILYPQTNYNGPPPNYVELELQIVPFLAATLYKIFGVHEIFGRLITLFFSVATVGVLGLFGRWLFGSWAAGLTSALIYAIVPGSIYYGRTFTPDATMVFFLTAALYASARFIFEDDAMDPRNLARVTALVSLAYLAKPVALVGIIPIVAMLWERARSGRTMRPTAVAVLLFVPVVILYLYQRNIAQHAEWHWASGIMQLHVIPALQAAVTSSEGFALKASQFGTVFHMFADTMLGRIPTLITVIAIALLFWISLPRERAQMNSMVMRSKTLLWGWLVGGLIYTYVVVTVERVDYYMFLLLPLAALFIAGLIAYLTSKKTIATAYFSQPTPRWVAGVIAFALTVWIIRDSQAAVASYYTYNKQAYQNAIVLSHALPLNTLVVMGHYGPDVLYYIGRFGWEEDPELWTPFDEESAIKKGARYFISIEDNRLRHNVELCAWLQRFRLLNTAAEWPVYETDPLKILPGAEASWKQFRFAERKGQARQFLDTRHLCISS